MARSENLKKMFRAFRKGDSDLFMQAADAVIEEERLKHHVVLANELQGILQNGHVTPLTPPGWSRFPASPRDPERGSTLLEIRRPDRLLKELILSDVQSRTILRVLEEFRNWEVLQASGLPAAHKLLFCGPPGCGKTVCAEAIASEIGVPLVYVRFDGVVSSLLGQTAQNLRAVFDYVRQDTWVLFFDEFDAVGRSRDDSTEHGEIKRVVNTFLQLLDGFRSPSLVIAATNFEASLDPALWRRFDEIVRFDLPTLPQIEALMKLRLRLLAGDANLDALPEKLLGFSHADVERVCLYALKTCILRRQKRWSIETLTEAMEEIRQRRQVMKGARADATPHVSEQ